MEENPQDHNSAIFFKMKKMSIWVWTKMSHATEISSAII